MTKQHHSEIKILVTGTRGIPGIQGGIETHCEELYPRIAGTGCAVTVMRRTPYVRDNLGTYKGVVLINLYAPRSNHFEAFIHTLLSIVYAKWKGYTLIHIHGIGPSLFVPAARLLGLKVILTNHGPDYRRQKWGKGTRFILRLGELVGTTFAHKVIAVSRYIQKRLMHMYSRPDCVFIPNGVKIQKKVNDNGFLKQYGLVKNSYILAVGRFVPEKGFHDLIVSFSKIKHKKMKLVIAGDADYETEYSRKLKKDAVNSGCVLTGFIQKENLAQLYTHACLFVLPSYHEGLPFSLLEALSYGTDVLVSNIPALNGLGLDSFSYFKTGDVAELSKKIEYKLDHPGAGINRETLLSEYDWDVIAQKTYALYTSVIRPEILE